MLLFHDGKMSGEREEKVVGSRHGWPRITARLPASSGIVGPVSSS